VALVTPIGNYFVADTPLHRADTRVKLMVLVCFLVGLFLLRSWVGLVLFGLALVAGYVSARIPFKMFARSLSSLVAILIFIILFSSFGTETYSLAVVQNQDWPVLLPEGFFGSEQAAAAYSVLAQQFVPLFGGFGLLPAGFLRGLFMALRIIMLLSATTLLTSTSSMVALTDALVSMLRPLARFGVPTEDIATAFSITLRFITIITDEIDRIMVAQQARGAVFDKGGLMARARAWQPVFVPLFVKLFSRADNLTSAMDTRCYRGQGRTHLRTNELKPQALVLGMLVAAVAVTSGIVF